MDNIGKTTGPEIKQLDYRLEDFLIDQGKSMEWINRLVEREVFEGGGRTRQSLLGVSEILTTMLEEEFSVKIPFTFGGGHFVGDQYKFPEANGDFNESEATTINPNWGFAFSKEDIQRYKHTDGTLYPNYGPDGSSFIMILLKLIGVENNLVKTATTIKNGAIYREKNEKFYPLGKVYCFSKDVFENLPNKEIFQECYSMYDPDVYKAKPGDLIHTESDSKHGIANNIKLITSIDVAEKKVYTTEARGGKFGVVRTCYAMQELLEYGRASLISIDYILEDPEGMMKKYPLR